MFEKFGSTDLDIRLSVLGLAGAHLTTEND